MVLVILGALVGVAVLSAGIAGPSRGMKVEAERLQGVLTLLADQALLDNREYGLQISPHAYQVWFYDEAAGQWQVYQKEAYRLPASMQFQLELEGTRLQLAALSEAEQGADQPSEASIAPQILLLSSGELSAFRLRISLKADPKQSYQLHSDGFALPQLESGS